MEFEPSDALQEALSHAILGNALDIGAGEGQTAVWLATQGYLVQALEGDPARFAILEEAATAGVEPVRAALEAFSFPEGRYTLIVAEAVLHFLRPTVLWSLADELTRALTPGGVFVATALTTDDPGCAHLRETAVEQIEPNTYRVPADGSLRHYFDPGELQRVFAALQVISYREYRGPDAHNPLGYYAGAALVARRPARVS